MIFRFSAMGDVAMLVPVLRCLYAQNQNIQITLVTPKRFALFLRSSTNYKSFRQTLSENTKGLKDFIACTKSSNKSNLIA